MARDRRTGRLHYDLLEAALCLKIGYRIIKQRLVYNGMADIGRLASRSRIEDIVDELMQAFFIPSAVFLTNRHGSVTDDYLGTQP